VIRAIAESNFTTSLFGALAGAWGGARAAQRIAERARRREFLLQEVRNSNAAIEFAYSVCNAALSLKQQHVRDLKATYDAQRRAVHEHDAALRAGRLPRGTPLELGALDLGFLDVVRVRTDRLESLVLEDLSVTGKPRPLVSVLLQSVESLNHSIEFRNELINEMKQLNMTTEQRVPIIFGLPLAGGSVDERYRASVEHISRGTNDCIYFSASLMRELHRHAERARAEFLKKFDKKVPKVHQLDFGHANRAGLMPAESDYAAWNAGFASRVDATQGRWLEKGLYSVRKMLRVIRLRARSSTPPSPATSRAH
jgi:hypothetical protein